MAGRRCWVQNNIAALFVAGDGTCYTDSFWDEAGHEAGIYKDGGVVGGCDDWRHGHGGFAVAVDASHLDIAYRLKEGCRTVGYTPNSG